MARVALDQLCFRYPGSSADTLTDLTLTIEDGAAHALLGGSGTGKTTLLNLFSGLLVPTSGAVLFDDQNVSALPGRERQVAQVFQFPVLYEGLSLLDNLAFPLRTRGWKAAAARERAMQLAKRLDIAGLASKLASNLSLFEKQLLAIGKALVRPDLALVLLDEPLTAVEPRVKWQLRSLLREVQREEGTTMLYVTHDQTEALTFADQVSLMHQGQLLQTGTPTTLHDAPEHEYVGHFIGSPGMNLVPGQVQDQRLLCNEVELGACSLTPEANYRVGFRDNWAKLSVLDDRQSVEPCVQPPQALAAHVLGTRLLGTRMGEPQVQCRLQLGATEVQCLTTLQLSVGQKVQLDLARYLLFCDGKRVAINAG